MRYYKWKKIGLWQKPYVYKNQDAPQNQEALINLLREVQEYNNGILPFTALQEIAEAMPLKMSFLEALIKRYAELTYGKRTSYSGGMWRS